MRFQVELELKTEVIPVDYRPVIISLYKHALTEYEGGKYFNIYYDVGKSKPFTFAVGLPNCSFTKDTIKIPNKKIIISFSTHNKKAGIVFFNALATQKNKGYPLAHDNIMTIRNIVLGKEFDITANSIDVIYKSPLCVRKHIVDSNKDIYYSFEKEGFNEALNDVVGLQLARDSAMDASALRDFSIAPIQGKKTVVRHHAQFVEVTVGSFRLSGNPVLLSYLYSGGMGSRSSSGFGLFDIVRQDA